jgi:hypothetical protein
MEDKAIKKSTQPIIREESNKKANISFTGTWKNVEEELPKEGGRFWCIVQEQNCLGKSHFQWNCDYNENDISKWKSDEGAMNVIWWTELPNFPF